MATILFIDDEDPLRKLCQTALEGAGYRVLTAETGARPASLSASGRWIWPSSIFIRAWTAEVIQPS
jgi:CheY-like chemotaxis protein